MRACLTVAANAILTARSAAVCGQPQPRLVCAEYFSSRVVVNAKLVRSRYTAPLNDIDGHYYEMQTERTFRGDIGKSFQIWEENSNGRATFDWKVGHSYILFLQTQELNGGWVIDGCGNSGPLENRQKAREKIDAIDPTSQRALIQGAVRAPSSTRLTGIKVEARGPAGELTTTTKPDGTFVLHVAPGKYQIRAFSPERTFVADDFTYEKPDDLVLENGGCAQIQFIEAPEHH